MQSPPPKQPPSADDATLDGSHPTPSEEAASINTVGRWRSRVALIEGSGAGLVAETALLLRLRLRIAAILLVVTLAGLLVRHTFLVDFGRAFEVRFYAMHALTMVIVGTITLWLWRRSEIPVSRLRKAELVVFGLPAGLLLVLQYVLTIQNEFVGFFEFPIGPWLVLIYTYALFIPNSFGRAAVVISLIAGAPLVLLFTMISSDPLLAELVGPDKLITTVLLLLLAAVGSVFGVDTIGALRRAAFEARQLGQYRLKRLIGVGGMGEVYLAEHQLLKRPCVVKLIRPDKAGDPRVLARFQREVRATAKLTHWNVVEIYDYGVTDSGTFYYVMEHLPGMDLAELVEQCGPMPPPRVVYLLRQACDALGEAHAAGLIHRDIKPGNIFVARLGHVHDVVKLLDFGLVKPLADEQPIELTAEGGITGSPLFIAPEQVTGDREPDCRSDIYSLGAVGYYLLCGRPPFEGDRPVKVMFAHAYEEVVPPSKHRPEIPTDVERVILRCLAKSPDDRYQAVSSLGEALAACECVDGWSREHAAHWWQERQVGAASSSDASTPARGGL
jgi:serine/threonine-protein kinase